MKRAICFVFLFACAASAQTQFEVASLKPSGPASIRGWDGGPGRKDPTRYTFGQATILDLLTTAWNVKGFQVSSPAALDRDSFDLIATIPPGATKEQFRIMLQNLLTDRFGLKIHMESRDFPAYELVIAKGGLKLQEAVPGARTDAPPPTAGGACQWPKLPPGVANFASGMSASGGYNLVCVRAQLQPISALAGYLPTPDNIPVVDKTGLTGKYNFTLGYTTEFPGTSPDIPPVMPGVFNAIQQQLGLQLVSKKLPFDVVAVESFNRTPTGN